MAIAPTLLPNGNYSFTNDKGITTTGTKEAVQAAFDTENKASAPRVDPTIANSPVRRYTGTGVVQGNAPAGSQRSANGNWIGPDGAQYTGGPGDASAALNGPGSTTDRIAAYYAGLDTAQPDEAAIRAKMRADVQSQIDAINNELQATLAQDAITGENSMGRTRATGARSGTLGSDFGNAALDRTQQNNDRIAAADRAAAAAKIADVLSGVNTRADQKITAEKERVQKNSESYIQYLAGVANSAREDVKTLASSGHGYDKLTTDERQKLLDQTGYTDEQLKAQFVLNTPKASVLQSGVNGSTYYQITKDPNTGEIKSSTFNLGFTVPEGYNSQVLDTGQVLFTPKNWDGDMKKAIVYGQPTDKYKSEVAKNYAAAAKDKAAATPGLSTNEITKLGANGVPNDVAQGIYKDASNGYSDKQIKDNLNQTFGTELGAQYFNAFVNVMRQTPAQQAILTALGVAGG